MSKREGRERWSYEPDGSGAGRFVVKDENGLIVACGIPSEDDARLLAAAPLLDEALEAVMAYYCDENTPFEDDEEREAVELAGEAQEAVGVAS